MNLSHLFTLDFWFNLSPTALSPGMDKVFFFLFSIMVVAGAVARILARKKNDDRYLVRAYTNFGNMLVSMGLLGFVFFFFTYEEIYLLGARFWFVILGVGLITWFAFIVRYVKVKIPELRLADEEKHRKNQYIPRKKRRK